MQIPSPAIKYILLQRTNYLYLTSSRPFQRFRKILPFITYERSVAMEGFLRKKSIKKTYELEMKNDYHSLRRYLPKSCCSVLDIGCGVAGIDVWINRHYLDSNINFYLFDKTKTEKKIIYGFKEDREFYNSLRVAKSLLTLNDICEETIFLLEATEENEIHINGPIDLILSLISWGYHYPVSVYLNEVHELLSSHGTLILDEPRSET